MKTNMQVRFRFARRCNLAAALMLVLLVATVAHAQLTPSGDSYTNSADPTTNYGAKTLLDVESPSQTTYIQFNLESIPAGYTGVSKATLKLYVNAVTTAGSFNVDYVTGTWTESTITSSLAPALGTTIAASVPLVTADKNQYILIDITAAVQAWLNGSQANDGIALVGNSPFNATFDSKENTTTSHPPELDIVFAVGTLTGVTTASGSGLTGGGTSGTLNLRLLTTCASGQVLEWNGTAWACATGKGTGTITGVTAGTDLTGGGTSGKVTLNLDTTKVPLLAAANTFTAEQLISSGGGSPSLSVSNSGGAAGVYSIAAGAGIFGETTTNTALGGVMGVDGSAVGTGTGVYGTSSSGHGVYGASATGYGAVGVSTAGGIGVSGTVPAGGTGVYGENQSTSVGGDGILGRAHTNSGNGVHGINDASTAVGVYGENSATNGYGVYGHAPNGYGMATDSNASQARSMGGWVKAMAYVKPTGSGIVRCFNSQIYGSSAATVPCGMTFTYLGVGNYIIDFGFQVDDRFLQVNPALSIYQYQLAVCLDDICGVVTSTQAEIFTNSGTDVAFFVIVF